MGKEGTLEISELGKRRTGCGRHGCNGVAGNGWGEEAAGDERAWLRGRLRTANGCGELRGRLRTGAMGAGELGGRSGSRWCAAEWLETAGEKKPLVMSELGCADGCGRQIDGCGAREWLEMGGEKKLLVMSDAWLRGRLRTENGCGELRGRLRTAWVQGGGWKWVGRRSRW